MEIGDLFYIIILSLFMILGFFNDSRKKKNEQKQQTLPKPNTNNSDEPDVIPPLYKRMSPPLPETSVKKRNSWEKDKFINHENEDEIAFQSSMDLLTDFSKESSLKSSIYVHDTGETYSIDTESHNRMDTYGNYEVLNNNIINDLIGENKRSELVKGLIYSEILKKKY